MHKPALLITLLALALAAFSACPKRAPDASTAPPGGLAPGTPVAAEDGSAAADGAAAGDGGLVEPPRNAKDAVPAKGGADDPRARGEQLFTQPILSTTGLSCADCHSLEPKPAPGRIYIAHSLHDVALRRAWWVPDAAAQQAFSGGAASLEDAIVHCVTAPYLNYRAVIDQHELATLSLYLRSQLDPSSTGGKPRVTQQSWPLPKPGLKPDLANGARIYREACLNCHGKYEGIEKLEGAKDWLTPLQIMAKLRKAPGDWYNDNKGKTYARAHRPLTARLLALAGIESAAAQDGGGSSGGGQETAPGVEGAAQAGEEEIFPEGAMPGFAPDILSDQDVVDVAHYVATL